MNGGHGQWNGTTFCLRPASACNFTMVRFKFGDAMDSARKEMKLCYGTGSGSSSDASGEKQIDTIGSTSVRGIAASVDQTRSVVHKILQSVLRYVPHKLSLLQQILPNNLDR
ncbi:hypothetical protein TNCV_3795541 [Trichonephila clavipes]|nr:hypothetical protein TNCV_3795541 [Trichonephila clavipes]